MSKALLELVRSQFGSAVLETHNQHGDETAILEPNSWHAVAKFLRDDSRAAMNMLVDLTAVDFPDREPRFDVVAHFVSLSLGHRLRLKARVGKASGAASIATLSDLWASANWMERECFDMFGVVFTGHSDLRRILMYPEFEGHPLRKDYPADRIQPLLPYRDVPSIEKVAPFTNHEGMSFGRQVHDNDRKDGNDPELFPTTSTGGEA
ncbi:MAG TPA: NADH-quinone oxidoreductase subunit C [Polyangiaceae bacterium]|nr:NADH-quinone oxidoreductase subunit C [Polyangiaceae bacterium]